MYKLLKINETEYKIRLNLNALSEFKTLNNGVGVLGLMADLHRGMFTFDIDETILLFYVGAKYGSDEYNKNLEETREMFEEIFDEEGFGFIDYISSQLLLLLTEGKKKEPQVLVAKQN